MTPAWFAAALAKHPRIAIAGGPRTGKTTYSLLVADRPIIHTDDFMADAWENVPWIVIQRCQRLSSFVVEGVQVPRALRKGLQVDAVLWLEDAKVPLTDEQRTMAKAVKTVFNDWIPINGGRIPVIHEPRSGARG